VPGDSAGSTVGSAPAQFSDLAPGDTSGVIAMMRQVMRQIDAALPQMVERDTVLPAVADSQPRHLAIWLENGVVRKLAVGDSGGNGPGAGETDVWFMGGDVAVMQRIADMYAFDSDRIVLWTDESFQPQTEAPKEFLMARQTELIDLVRQWLRIFGIELP
jgi:hypothetical protein